MFSNYLYQKLNNIIASNEKIFLKNQNINFMIEMIKADFIQNHKTIFAILPTLYEAERVYEALINDLEDENVLFFPSDEIVAAQMIESMGDFKYERINTLVSLLEDNEYIVVTNLAGAIRFEASKEYWTSCIININKDSIIDEEKLYNNLLKLGYQFSYTVTKTGQFSHRGSIIDIFPLNYNNPIRLDLFDDTIDEMKYFDVDTQRSLEKIDEFTIIPVVEMVYDNEILKSATKEIADYAKKINVSELEMNRINKDIEALNFHKDHSSLHRYISFFGHKSTIFDYKEDYKLYLIDYKKCEDNYNQMIIDLNNYSNEKNEMFSLHINQFLAFCDLVDRANVLSEGVVNVFENGIDYFTTIPADFHAHPEAIIKYLNDIYGKYTLVLSIKNQIRKDRLIETLLDERMNYNNCDLTQKIEENSFNIIMKEHINSFKSEALNLIVLDETTLFDIKASQILKPRYKSIYKNTTKISRYDELEIGDYVVHFDYGIGIYRGLKTLEASGVWRDYIQVEYDKGDSLYVPLEQIGSLEKYSAGEARRVTLSTLGTKKWSQAKEKVRRKLHNISQELIKLYASRSAAVGFACGPDTADQVLFEADFGYELTPDQAKAIKEIKAEMETEKVMDRLVCGDVGYGKTEIALRAAFKAVENGKQVALLAPTTILTRQHYYTFKNRMERFGIRVDLFNRMQKTKALNATREGLKSGEVDVVIGTHKLLGADIKFNNLGLLIIDEEQRFGVAQKEKIKSLKVNVDAITLSATPIPRTLQMSMMGIKTLSMLETPPKNRYPIQTYVLERNDSIIRDAITRELSRHGQVFYMYNFTETIYEVASHIQALVPEARICVGHGKMDKNELEDIIANFIDRKYDVLVCTTIIETGIDIPDANTLIIHDANRLGLSQLYQLRGRVGRSDKIAYAYLMYEPHYVLTETALKRLDTIKEFNELGSGFKIAMSDLAIRGAGDILGDEQSGFIESVGLETYLHILDEELKRITNPLPPEPPREKDASLNKAYADRLIPSKYIDNDDVKIEIHKRISKLNRISDIKELSAELRDRFGDYDEQINTYMYEMLLNKLTDKLEITKIVDNKMQMILFMSEHMSNQMDGNKMFALANSVSKNINLHYYNKQIEIIINKMKNSNHIVILSTFLDKLI